MIAVEVCRALAHAHGVGDPPPRRQAGERHDPQGRARQADGLRHRADVDLQRMTVTGQLLGSPAYMAPEHRRGQAARLPHRRVLGRHHALPAGDRRAAVPGKNPHEVLRRIAEGEVRRSAHGRPAASTRRCRASSPGRWRAGPTIATPTSARWPTTCARTWPRRGPGRRRARSCAATSPIPPRTTPRCPGGSAEALIAAAPRHLGGAQSAKALELWNRVLAFDPENAAVNAALRRLEGRARLKTAGARAGDRGALLASGRLVHGAALRPARRRPVATPAPVVAGGIAHARPAPTGAQPSPDRPARHERRRRRRRPRLPPPPPSAPPRARARSAPRACPARRSRGDAARRRRAGRHAHVQARSDAPERRRLPGRPAPVRLRRRPHDRSPSPGRACT